VKFLQPVRFVAASIEQILRLCGELDRLRRRHRAGSILSDDGRQWFYVDAEGKDWQYFKAEGK
jgi:hypothetical protein